MNCKIIERILKDRKVINGEKRERNMMKEEKIKKEKKRRRNFG